MFIPAENILKLSNSVIVYDAPNTGYINKCENMACLIPKVTVGVVFEYSLAESPHPLNV